jgi:hypothetical protein
LQGFPLSLIDPSGDTAGLCLACNTGANSAAISALRVAKTLWKATQGIVFAAEFEVIRDIQNRLT